MIVYFSAQELAILKRLRDGFLDGSNTGGAYWKNEAELELYNRTLGERIGWKWDAVLGELDTLGWRPKSTHILDWGCGSGIASRRVLGNWQTFRSLAVHDVSHHACSFTRQRVQAEFPGIKLDRWDANVPLPEGTLLVVSHVINELPPQSRATLLRLAKEANEVLWVEAGSHADSRALVEVREELRDSFHVIAPCTHREKCGLLTAENAHHWCHHFARVPSHAFQDAAWTYLSRGLGIDLGTLPYGYLALSKQSSEALPNQGHIRVLGKPREQTGRMQVLTCNAERVAETTLQKRDEPATFKAFRKDHSAPFHRWSVEAGKIRELPIPK